MARPYSLDFRERVVALVADGMSCRDVAELTNIVASTVVKWMQRQRQTGSAAAKAMGGKRLYLLCQPQYPAVTKECRTVSRLIGIARAR